MYMYSICVPLTEKPEARGPTLIGVFPLEERAVKEAVPTACFARSYSSASPVKSSYGYNCCSRAGSAL
jgi:hypothetical protein